MKANSPELRSRIGCTIRQKEADDLDLVISCISQYVCHDTARHTDTYTSTLFSLR